MRLTKTILISGAAGIAGILALAGFAIADPGCSEGGPGMGHGRAMMMRMMAERYDANNDGKLSQEEITTNRQQWLAEFDADKDGKLSVAEFEKLWLKARHRMMVREFQFLDSDGDGNVTIVEYQAPMANIVADRDRNGDGFLSRDDRPAGGHDGQRRWRHKPDKDQDGQGGDNGQPEPDAN